MVPRKYVSTDIVGKLFPVIHHDVGLCAHKMQISVIIKNVDNTIFFILLDFCGLIMIIVRFFT